MKRPATALLAIALTAILGAAAFSDVVDVPIVIEDGHFSIVREHLRPLAEGGDADAQTELGDLYLRGLGVVRDLMEAARWYARAVEQGHATAQRMLGLLYADGEGVPKDESKALELLRLSAGQMDPDAQFAIAMLMERGSGDTLDIATIRDFYRLAPPTGMPVHNLGSERSTPPVAACPATTKPRPPLSPGCRGGVCRGAGDPRAIASRRARCCEG